uniref:SH3 domain-containing protein n=1 Tax=Tetranychus urticae TaxID=32264 RepID=T1K9U1_TETUR
MSVKGQSESSSSGSTGLNRVGSFMVHSKSASLVAGCKSIFQEQSTRLSQKHASELELIDDVRTFFKVKCTIEKDYCSSLTKLCTSHLTRKYPSFEVEKDSDFKSIYSVWQLYLEEEEKLSKFRATQFEQIANVYDSLKHIKSHKSSIGKKGIDNYLKKQQEELIASAVEIDKNRKLYFDEEHLAKQARDKEEKVKKRKGGIFSKFTHSESKKEKIGAHREASDIQSTMARNEYILALVAGNAHLEHYYSIDLPNLMQFLEDDVLDKCKGFMLNLLNSETTSLANASEALTGLVTALESTSAELTDKAFLAEQASNCLRDTLQFEFEPCDGDQIQTVSIEHNAELALQHEIAKWMSCFTKECRNLHKLNQQLTKCLNYQATGKKTVEVTGIGVVEIETRIDDIKQQLRKCDISRCKAEARLKAIKQAGMPIEDLEAIESQIASEMKQTSLDVDVAQPLSRTPSLRSTNISEGRVSSMENKSFSDDQQEYNSQEPTPEPNERYSSEPEPVESPVEKEPLQQTYSYETYDTNAGWGDYDANDAWAEPEPPQEESISTSPAPVLPYPTDDTSSSSPPPPVTSSSIPISSSDNPSIQNNYDSVNYEEQADYTVTVDVSQLVGRRVRALYPYEALNQDELSFEVDQILTVLSAADEAWVTAQNDKYQVGYIPAAYVVLADDDLPPPPPEANGYTIVEPNDSFNSTVSQNEPTITAPVETQDSSKDDQDFNSKPQIENADHIQNVKALYDYTATSEEEISFKEGDIFIVIEKSEDGWWLGEKDGVKGHFPSMLVIDADEYEEEEEDEEDEDKGDEQSYKAESPGSESVDSNELPMPTEGPPPPTFAPPKPAYLTPHQVVIIQPTPEIESRGTFGEDVDESGSASDQQKDSSETNGNNDENPNANIEQDNVTAAEESGIEVRVEFDADFSLAKPNKKTNDQGKNY